MLIILSTLSCLEIRMQGEVTVQIDNSSFEKVEDCKYLGTTLTNQNSIQEEIKSRLKSWNACYYLVQNLLSSSLLSKNVKIKLQRSIILPVVLNGCETWSITLREERRLRVFENRVWRRIFVPHRNEVTSEWRKLHNEGLDDLYCSHGIVRVIKSRRMRWARHVANIGGERGVFRILMGKPEGEIRLVDPGVNGRKIIKWVLRSGVYGY